MKVLKLLILLVLLSGGAIAQKYYNDAQLRFNLGLEKRITKRFSVTLDQQDRFTKNFMEFNRASFDVGLTYKFSKHIKLKADYVFIEKKNKYNYFVERNWYYVAVILKQEVGKWKFFYRNMVQARAGNTNSAESGIIRYYDRNKITVRYDATRRWSYWVAQEIYIPLNNPQSKGPDRSRSYIGATLKTFKNQSLDIYFMYQAQLQRGKWYDQTYRYQNDLLNRWFVYGVNYNIEF